MSKEDNGGPAFPYSHTHTDGRVFQEEGMELRDYFAAKALQGCLTQGSWDIKNLARESYDIADAMIEARQK